MKFILALVFAFFALIAFASSASTKPQHCNLKQESGTCQQFQKLYFYDSTSNSCKEFEYGGCGGNGNRFDTKALCEKDCKK